MATDTLDALQQQKQELQWLMQVAENVTLYGFGGEGEDFLQMQINDRKKHTHQFKIYQLTQGLAKANQEMAKASMLRKPLFKKKITLLQKEIEALRAQDAVILGQGEAPSKRH